MSELRSRQYVSAGGEVRWFESATDHFRDAEETAWSRIPRYAKVKAQLALASEASGAEINPENSDIGIAVPDGQGGHTRQRVRWESTKGEWVSCPQT